MALNPPHNERLSDVLIAQVIHRIVPRMQESIIESSGKASGATFSNQHFVQDPKATSLSEVEMPDEPSYASNSSGIVTTPMSTTKKRADTPVWQRIRHSRATSLGSDKKGILSEPNQLKNSLAAAMAARFAHQRARGRMNQRKYRRKQTNKIASLQQDLRLLQEEIEMCKMRRSNRWDTITVKPTPWSVVVEYHRLFCRGVNPSLSATSFTQARPSLRMQYPIEFVHQLSFLQTVMMPRVVCNGKRISIEAHLEEWKAVSRIYPDFDMKLVHMKEGPSGEMVAASKATFTFTEDTLSNGFPHLVSNNNTNPIAACLVDQQLEICTVTRFVWDDTMGRVAELSSQTNLITPILNVLGSLEHVASVFSHALVTSEGHIIAE